MATTVPERHITVGVDGSRNSTVALRRAAAEAEARNVSLDVVRVLESPHSPTGFALAAEWAGLRELVARTVSPDQLATTRLHIVEGEPGPALVEAAQGSAMLVIGARTHSEAGNPLGGDTVPIVLLHAPCEVTICADQCQTATVGARRTPVCG